MLTRRRAATLALVSSIAFSHLACSPEAPPTTRTKPPARSSSEATTTRINRTIMEIQGAGHRSPVDGRRVETRGVVVAESAEVFFVQDPEGDGDETTSDGLCVLPPISGERGDAAAGVENADAPPPTFGSRAGVGQLLSLAGTVEEWQRRPNGLSVTCLRLEKATVLDAAVAAPDAVLLGRGGRRVPDRIADDDGLEHFDPESDGLDFFESLEGMRVRLSRARVVGATSRRGEVVVVADGGADASVLHSRGGLLRRDGDANPEALLIDGGFGVEPPIVDVGQSLDPVEGVLDYGWGIYRLHLLTPPAVTGSAPEPERTRLEGDDHHVTIASFNVLNLAASDAPEKVQKLARVIVDGLGSPDLLGVQEIQDENGPLDDGTVSARRTYELLVAAVVAAGGPRYEVRQLDPVDKADGGRPGANIRVGFLFRPERVVALDTATPAGGSSGAPSFDRVGGQLRLAPSPARLDDPAFDEDEARDWSGTRKPLIAQFRAHDRDLFVFNLHLRSKGGDDRVFGDTQPPVRHSEVQRTAQARAVRRLVDELLAADPDAWVVVLGDLNEHPGRPPVEVFEGALTNLVERVPASERYTYVYRGQSQVLDHVLVSRAVAEHGAPEIDIVHTAADYAAARQASDHEPIVVRLRMLE